MDCNKQERSYPDFQNPRMQYQNPFSSAPTFNIPGGHQDALYPGPPPMYPPPASFPGSFSAAAYNSYPPQASSYEDRNYDVSFSQPASAHNSHKLSAVEGQDFKPIAIPATNKQLGSAYLRAYPPVLQDYGISKSAFLDFLDKLNRASVGSAPVQLIGLAGGILAPFTAGASHIVAQSINSAAAVGNIAASITQTHMAMKAANRDLFEPCGLKAIIADVAALAKIAHIPILDPVTGTIDKRARLLQPLENPSYGSVQDYHPSSPGHGNSQGPTYANPPRETSAQERRLQALQPYIAHLEFFPKVKGADSYSEDPKAQSQPSGVVGLYNSLNASACERQRRKAEEKLLKDREKHNKHRQKDIGKLEDEYQKDMRKTQRDFEKESRRHGPGSREADEAQRKLEKTERGFQKKVSEFEQKGVKGDKEEKLMRKVHWLIIIPANRQI